MKILKKVSVVWKNGKYVFCSLRWDLFDSNNVGQQMLTFCWLNAPFCWKVTRKNAQNHGIAKSEGGFLVFGLQTLILEPDEVQSVLSTPPKQFLYMLSTGCLGFEWNSAKSRFSPNFLFIFMCKKWYVVSYISFAGSFSRSIHQLDEWPGISQHFQKDNTNLEVWKFFQNLIPF